MPILKDFVAKLKPGQFILLNVPVKNAKKNYCQVLTELQAKKYRGVFISLFRDYPALFKDLSECALDLKKITFVDGISEVNGIKKEKSDKVIYVPSPFFLDDIIKSARKLVKLLSGTKKFLFLDSATALSLYNPPDEIIRFIRSLKKIGPGGFVVVVKVGAGNPELMRILEDVSDTTLDLTKE
ncbi:MAG: hypothetical protein ABII13_01700 [Patescibacteria group bacterium]|nr:hypothetical protein [Patescibacteria group bacterium]MBU2509402.1 hypothetical protein [Patescibacteria group bacterium]